jgi:hypothetical protein
MGCRHGPLQALIAAQVLKFSNPPGLPRRVFLRVPMLRCKIARSSELRGIFAPHTAAQQNVFADFHRGMGAEATGFTKVSFDRHGRAP